MVGGGWAVTQRHIVMPAYYPELTQDAAAGKRGAAFSSAHKGLLVDNHVHTKYAGHSAADSDIVSVRWAGLHRGLRVSLREHAPLPDGFELRQVGRPGREFPSVSTAVGLSLRDHSLGAFFVDCLDAGLSVGFEVDILGGRLDLTEELVAEVYRQARSFGVTIDALNCSHHVMGEAPWDFTPQTLAAAIGFCGGPAAFIRRYFAEIREAVATGLFQCVSHIEAPRKFDMSEALPEPPFSDVEDVWWGELERTLEALAVHGVALEYNTGGLTTWGRPYLGPPALALAVELGIRLVVGSDAHSPEHIGRGFVDAEREIATAGATEVWTFIAGQPVPIPLS
ncbi:MAG: hypothetical protein C4551_08205 [Bacillota bacterium]|nr:MAG: hypothetical protein C4551_08205 [Bacillota bacterium]